jgi:hypothetical protein
MEQSLQETSCGTAAARAARTALVAGLFDGEVRFDAHGACREARLAQVGHDRHAGVTFSHADLSQGLGRCVPLLLGGPRGPSCGFADGGEVHDNGYLYVKVRVRAADAHLLNREGVGCTFSLGGDGGPRLHNVYVCPQASLGPVSYDDDRDGAVSSVTDDPDDGGTADFTAKPTKKGPRPPDIAGGPAAPPSPAVSPADTTSPQGPAAGAGPDRIAARHAHLLGLTDTGGPSRVTRGVRRSRRPRRPSRRRVGGR